MIKEEENKIILKIANEYIEKISTSYGIKNFKIKDLVDSLFFCSNLLCSMKTKKELDEISEIIKNILKNVQKYIVTIQNPLIQK